MGKKCPPCKKGSPGWMTTYGDMTTLLLTFFILMFNISEISQVKLNLVLSAFNGSFSVYSGGTTMSKGILADMGMTVQSLPSSQVGSRLNKAIKQAKALLEPEIKSKKVMLRDTKRGFVISLVGDTFFEPGDARLLPETKKILDKVAKLLIDMKRFMKMDNQVELEGHADSGQIPPSSPYYNRFPTNLDLASARSNNAIKYLWASGVPETRRYKNKTHAKLKSVSYGEFQPLEKNVSPEKRAYNRRIDIVIVREDE